MWVTMKNPNDKGFSVIVVPLIILAIAAIGVAGWLVYQYGRTSMKANTNTAGVTTDSADKPAQTDPYAGWKSYSSNTGGYSIKYPSTWTLNPSPTGAINGEVLITSSSARADSFGVWLTLAGTSSPISSAYSAYTQLPYAQGSVIQTLSNGVGIWEANQTLISNGHTYADTCTPFESVASGSFGFKLSNGKYLDAAMSFCFAAKQSTTKNYAQQAQSSELQEASKILSSLTQ